MDAKTCTRCLNPKPLDQFRRRGRNDDRPAAHCHECHRLAVEMWRDRQRLKTVNQFAHAVEKADDDLALAQAAKAAMGAFRGPVGFAVAWKAALEAAPAGTRGRMLNAVLLLSTAADRQTYVDKSLMSDEDLDRAIADCEQRIADRIIASRNTEAASGQE